MLTLFKCLDFWLSQLCPFPINQVNLLQITRSERSVVFSLVTCSLLLRMVVGQSMLRLESDEDMGTREQIPAEAEESNKQPGWEAETHVWFHRRQLTGELVKQQNKRRRFKKKTKKKTSKTLNIGTTKSCSKQQQTWIQISNNRRFIRSS